MPLKLFWTLCNNIQRIQARDDLRSLSVSCSSAIAGGMSGNVEGVTSLRESLIQERGDVIKHRNDPILDAVRDDAGIESLRRLSQPASSEQ